MNRLHSTFDAKRVQLRLALCPGLKLRPPRTPIISNLGLSRVTVSTTTPAKMADKAARYTLVSKDSHFDHFMRNETYSL
jgi:hypothetical protein